VRVSHIPEELARRFQRARRRRRTPPLVGEAQALVCADRARETRGGAGITFARGNEPKIRDAIDVAGGRASRFTRARKWTTDDVECAPLRGRNVDDVDMSGTIDLSTGAAVAL